MTGETQKPKGEVISFEDLEAPISEYQEAFSAHNGALFVNMTHDDPTFPNVSRQMSEEELQQWMQEFPRTPDDEVAVLEQKLEEVEGSLVDRLGLESREEIPGLVCAFREEQTRQSAQQFEEQIGIVGARGSGAQIQDGTFLSATQFIQGAITMSRLTGETYPILDYLKVNTIFYYHIVEVNPDSEVQDVLEEFPWRKSNGESD